MSFYDNIPEDKLRLGDVLTGYIIVTPEFAEPSTDKAYKIRLEPHKLFVVMTPCCSVGKEQKKISITPLLSVRDSLFQNTFLKEDLTRVNRKMEAKNTLHEKQWEKLSEEERQKHLKEEYTYAFVDLFVYEEHALLPQYEIKYFDFNSNRKEVLEIGCYMVNFSHIFNVDCNKLMNRNYNPEDSKILQLSIPTREELRRKLAFYYGHIPAEDKLGL